MFLGKKYKDSSWDGSLGSPPAQVNVVKIRVAKSGQYLLFTSGLRLGWLCLGGEATAGMQEAAVTQICTGNGRHPARVKEKVLLRLSPTLPGHRPLHPAPLPGTTTILNCPRKHGASQECQVLTYAAANVICPTPHHPLPSTHSRLGRTFFRKILKTSCSQEAV